MFVNHQNNRAFASTSAPVAQNKPLKLQAVIEQVKRYDKPASEGRSKDMSKQQQKTESYSRYHITSRTSLRDHGTVSPEVRRGPADCNDLGYSSLSADQPILPESIRKSTKRVHDAAHAQSYVDEYEYDDSGIGMICRCVDCSTSSAHSRSFRWSSRSVARPRD